MDFWDMKRPLTALIKKSLWKLMSHYGTLQKFIYSVKVTYKDTRCKVIHK